MFWMFCNHLTILYACKFNSFQISFFHPDFRLSGERGWFSWITAGQWGSWKLFLFPGFWQFVYIPLHHRFLSGWNRARWGVMHSYLVLSCSIDPGQRRCWLAEATDNLVGRFFLRWFLLIYVSRSSSENFLQSPCSNPVCALPSSTADVYTCV